jgi:ribosomal-protein-alanine N-acetyltransferase
VKLAIELMQQEDIAEVSKVDHICFTNPWPQSAYRRELRNPTNNYYIVLRDYDAKPSTEQRSQAEQRGGLNLLPFLRKQESPAKPPIIGFAGMWMLLDEAHVTTIGVLPEYRGKGLGELLLVSLFQEAMRRDAEWVTLEVRVSNEPAQALYTKYGFTRQGIRRGYYSDNGEDAYIMWSPSMREPETIARMNALTAALEERLRDDLNWNAGSTGGQVSK